MAKTKAAMPATQTLRLTAELLDEPGRANEAAQLPQYGPVPASRIANERHQSAACPSHL